MRLIKNGNGFSHSFSKSVLSLEFHISHGLSHRSAHRCFDDNMDQALKKVVETRYPPTLPLGASPNTSGRSFTSLEIMGNNVSFNNNHVATKDQGIWVGLQVMVGNQEEVRDDLCSVSCVFMIFSVAALGENDLCSHIHFSASGGAKDGIPRSHLKR